MLGKKERMIRDLTELNEELLDENAFLRVTTGRRAIGNRGKVPMANVFSRRGADDVSELEGLDEEDSEPERVRYLNRTTLSLKQIREKKENAE